jgi:hypothetical protein
MIEECVSVAKMSGPFNVCLANSFWRLLFTEFNQPNTTCDSVAF